MTANDNPEPGLTELRHGGVSYLQIPALDTDESASFYEQVFGWEIEHPHPSFVAPGLIGQWVSDRQPARDSGLLAWLNVDDIDATLVLVRAAGCDVVEPTSTDGPRLLATISDPAGNALGIVQHGGGAGPATGQPPPERS